MYVLASGKAVHLFAALFQNLPAARDVAAISAKSTIESECFISDETVGLLVEVFE